ncbi:MAG: alkaline phosphatase family protein, partial [Bacteroidaceae bacterium]|nr:alkaline phosphatase family protein [Bacteroidaceae bacterium]
MTNLSAQRIRLLTSLLILMSVAGAEAQTAPEVPRLVVNVVIDQLRTDYMEAFSPLYSERGFMRLLKQGRVYTQAEYPFANPNRASAIACFMSGTSPYENGIVGERWLDRQTLTPVYCVDDKEFQGQHTTVASSPQHLGVSTITDELKVATEGNGLVYAIAP